MMSEAKHDFSPGRWAIYQWKSGYAWDFTPQLSAMEIEKETAVLILGKRGISHYIRQLKKSEVLFVLSTKEEAQALIDKSNGLSGEMQRRITAARDWAKFELNKLIEDHQ